MVSCDIVSGSHCIPAIGAYLSPSTLDHLLDLEEALNRFPGREPVVLGDLNTNIGRLTNPPDQQVADFFLGILWASGPSETLLKTLLLPSTSDVVADLPRVITMVPV